MRAVKLICSAVLAVSAFSLPAFAGEPGPNFRPAPAPAPAPQAHYQQQSSGWGHSYSSGTSTRDLNIQSMHSIQTVQAMPTATYSYSGSGYSSGYSSSNSTYSYSTGSGCYTPSPCSGAATTYAAPATTTYAAPATTTRTYTTTRSTCASPCGTTTTYVAPAPAAPVYYTTPTTSYAAPCHQVSPCAVPTAPPVAYHQQTVAYTQQPVQRYDWLAIEECRENTIRRLPNTRSGDRQYEVCYSDLMHLSDSERNSELLDRIETASQRACRDQGISSFYSSRARRECREEATEDAVYAANLPGLVELYNRREGIYTPSVNVGRPIMN